MGAMTEARNSMGSKVKRGHMGSVGVEDHVSRITRRENGVGEEEKNTKKKKAENRLFFAREDSETDERYIRCRRSMKRVISTGSGKRTTLRKGRRNVHY